MILCVACQCGNSENLMRRILRNAGLKDWGTHQVYKGKNDALQMVADLAVQGYDVNEVKDHIALASTFVVVIGYENGKVFWEDFANGDADKKIRAEEIVKRFA